MKKLIISALILGVVLGVCHYIVFAVFKEDLYENKVLLNTITVIGAVIVFAVSFLIAKRVNNKTDYKSIERNRNKGREERGAP